LILGRPFLATCHARIDVSSGEITLRFDGQAKNDDKERTEENDEEAKAMVKTRTKSKQRWKNDKLTWKNTWVPKCFLPTTKEYG